MAIVISLTLELEEKLQRKANHRGQDISVVTAEILTSILEWETQDLEEAVKGIQQGLDDFEAGSFRSFNEFADEQSRKYNLPV
jgi:predicted transcriptional regulator